MRLQQLVLGCAALVRAFFFIVTLNVTLERILHNLIFSKYGPYANTFLLKGQTYGREGLVRYAQGRVDARTQARSPDPPDALSARPEKTLQEGKWQSSASEVPAGGDCS